MNFSAEILGDRSTARSQAGSPFMEFVASVSEYAKVKVGEEKAASAASGFPEVRLTFVYLPLIKGARTPAIAVPKAVAAASLGASHLASPWVNLSIERSPRLGVRGVFIWNERQLLLDQAMMAGARAWPADSLAPIAAESFDQLVGDYAASVLTKVSDERAQALAGAAQRIPPDVLWLCTQAWQSTRGPFFNAVTSALTTVFKGASPAYTRLVRTLMDRPFATAGTQERYENILELQDVSELKHYRLEGR